LPGSIFKDKASKPDSETLVEAMGKTAAYWKELRLGLEQELGELIEDWKFYGQKSGWILKLLRKKRNLFFVTPQEGFFRVAFVFGDKAVAEVESSDLPESIKETLRNARKYAEGRGLQIEVTAAGDVDVVKELVWIKVGN
jgi:hypothetical protein